MSYTLPQFLELLFDYCDSQNIEYCFARNYADLPNDKQSGDLDLIITAGHASDIINWVIATDGLMLVNKTAQKDVDHLFIAGVHWGNGFHAIQLDLFSNLSWKGIPFLPLENVLLRARAFSQDNKQIKRPDPIDEMVLSFFSKVINAGMIKDKDWKRWRVLCEKKPQAIRDKFKRRLGDFYSNALIDHIERDDREGVLKNKQRWRFGFLQNNWHQEGLHLGVWMTQYFWSILKTRFSFKKTSRIVFFGVDGAGKTTTLHGLKQTLENFSKRVDVHHVRPSFLSQKQDDPKTVLENPQGKPLRSPFMSVVKLFYFLGLYWLDAIKLRREPSIKLYDRYFHDMIVDPKRYRFGGSEKLLHFFLKLIPTPDLAVLVDVAPDVAQSRKKEVSEQETERQCQAYREMVPLYFKNHIIVSGEVSGSKSVGLIHDRFVEALGQKISGK